MHELKGLKKWELHCVKCVRLRSYSSVFSHIQTEYGKKLFISPYSVRMQENADQNNSKDGHFLHSAISL